MKKLFSILLVVALMMVPITTALAAETEEVEADGKVFDAPVIVEDKQVFCLPTGANFDFVLDPQGIYGMTEAQIRDLDINTDGRLGQFATPGDSSTPWSALPNAGRIVFTEDYAPYAVNESTFDASLEIEFEFTAFTTASPPVAVPAGTIGTVQEYGDIDDTVTANDIFLGAVFSTSNVDARPTGFSGTLALPIERTPKTPLFFLEAADYEKIIDIETDDDGIATAVTVYMNGDLDYGTGNGTQFMFLGACSPNPATKWHELEIGTEIVLGIEIKYNFDEAGSGDSALVDIGAAAGLKAVTGLVAGDYDTVTAVTAMWAAFGFKTSADVTAFSNLPFYSDQYNATYAGRAHYTFEFGDGDGKVIPFDLAGCEVDAIYYSDGVISFTDVTSTFDLTTGIEFGPGWDASAVGDKHELYIVLNDGGPAWQVLLTITPAP